MRTIILLLLCLQTWSLPAQIVTASEKLYLDTCKTEYIYQQTISGFDTIRNQPYIKENEMVLQIGKHMSKYCDKAVFILDSFEIAQARIGATFQEATRNTPASTFHKTREQLFKNYPEGQITTQTYCLGTYYYEEELRSPKWELLPDTDTICGYFCHKARGGFGGRTYEAWYTPDIPISEGPWKLTGLPGLILKASAMDSQVNFICKSIQIPKEDKAIFLRKNVLSLGFKTTKERFRKQEVEFYKNPGAMLMATGMVKGDLPPIATQERFVIFIESELE